MAGKGSNPPPRSSSLRIERLKKVGEMGERSEVNKKGKEKYGRKEIRKIEGKKRQE